MDRSPSQAGRRRFEPGRPLWMWLRMNHLRKWPAGLGGPFLHSERSLNGPQIFQRLGTVVMSQLGFRFATARGPGFRDCSSGLADRRRLGKANCAGWPSTADARQARGAAIAVQRVVERLSEGCEVFSRRLGALRAQYRALSEISHCLVHPLYQTVSGSFGNWQTPNPSDQLSWRHHLLDQENTHER